MSNLTFAWPYAAILFLVLIFWLFKKYNYKNNDFIYSYIFVIIEKFNTSKIQKSNSLIYFALIWCLLILALMRPQFVGNQIELPQMGRNLMLAIDISESMQIEDMQINGQTTNRLNAVKKVVTEFINRRKSDFIGLVLFGSESFLHAPLSSDHKTIAKFLLEAQIGFLGPKTAIGEALLLGIKKLSEQNNGDKVLILLTDGQNNSGFIEPLDAANIAVEKGVKIYIIGVGSEKMIVNSFFGPSVVNPSQDLEESESLLKHIAKITNGAYFRSTDTDSLETIYKKLDELEPSIKENQGLILRKELFYWPLSIALLLFFIRRKINS